MEKRFSVISWSGLAGLLCLLTIGVTTGRGAERYVFDHENILGTSLEIQVDADNDAAAQAVEADVLAEIERLAKIFSTYYSESEFSRWQRTHGEPVAVSPELFELLSASDTWRERGRGAFNPAVETMSRLWKKAQERNALPTDAVLAAAVAQVSPRQWSLDPRSRQATRLAQGPLSLNAIAKGAIVDRACERASNGRSGVHAVIVNIGGDLRTIGNAPERVDVANPFRDAVNAPPLSTIYVQNAGVATSGNYRRGFTIDGKRYSHVIDPRTGRPVSRIASATVVGPTTSNANALAVLFNVLTAQESLTLAENLTGFEWLVVGTDGQKSQSRGWGRLEKSPGAADSTDALAFAVAADEGKTKEADTADKSAIDTSKSADGLLELLVKFELNRPSGQGYRRPYVAIWLEDKDEFPVRTAVLWMQTKQPGPRWHRDLLRWFRNDRTRKLADDKDLIGTISSATRGPGEYKAVFDGKDDAGKPLPPGKYTLYIEAAREHGTYQLIKHELQLGRDPLEETKLKTNVEIKSASVEYRVPGTTDAAGDAAGK